MDTIALPVVDSSEPQKQVEKKLGPNPTGHGGFGANPQNINRDGRPPKEWTFKQLLLDAAEEVIEIRNKQGVVVGRGKAKDLVAKNLWRKAAARADVQAFREIADRIEGKVMQKIDHTTQGEKMPGPVVFMPEEKHE